MLYAIVVVLLLIADQGLKYWVTVHVALNEGRHVLIPKVLDIMNIHNYGIAFSWLQNVPSWVFAIIAAIFAAVVIVALKRGMIHGRFGRWMAVLALAGAIGNCIDRVLSGYVVDMLAFAFWKSFPVFNLADACLVVGGIAFCLYVIFRKDPEEQKDTAERKPSAAHARKPARKKASADKPALGSVLAQKSAALRKNADAKLQQAKSAAQHKRAESQAKAAAKPEPAAKKPAGSDDPFAAWDRAVSEQDARDRAEAERRARLRAEREAKRAALAKEAAAVQSVPEVKEAPADGDADVKVAPPAKKPVVDDAPTRKVAAQKIEEMAAKLAPKKPEPAARPEPAVKPEPPKEEAVSYDLEDILREFADL